MRKSAILLAGMLLPGISAYNQAFNKDISRIRQQLEFPVQWEYSAKQVNDTVYELHLTAVISPGWHVYAQKQPEDAIAVPTTIKFDSNPSLAFTGQTKETGKLEKFTEPALGISAWQYEDKVDFIQTVILKKNMPARVSGSIIFQACTQDQCLQPETVSFDIPVNQ